MDLAELVKRTPPVIIKEPSQKLAARPLHERYDEKTLKKMISRLERGYVVGSYNLFTGTAWETVLVKGKVRSVFSFTVGLSFKDFGPRSTQTLEEVLREKLRELLTEIEKSRRENFSRG